MSKKINKLLFLSLVAGGAVGTYRYLKNKKSQQYQDLKTDASDEDDFDFDEDYDEEKTNDEPTNDRYITLESRLNLSHAMDTAKEVMDSVVEKVTETVSKVADATLNSLQNDTTETEAQAVQSDPEEEESEVFIEDDFNDDFVETAKENSSIPLEKVEEFFDDENQPS